ncbi:4'-phosphopantetheinyl transferase [Lentinula detonsa]|uniref:4'-phosphopantetheinyl transferase n=1 Tax=Lentinula detonsa TaxID=2804962 RepID=A0A9W8TUU5_9AGAR|nr:4'-phosphopantetheinyl transferase [Lentinula detonsa]
MTILGVGTDIAQIPRILSLIRRRSPEQLAYRILSEVELGHWGASRSGSDIKRDAQFLAVRWALKEAAYKALYPTYRPTWKDLAYYPLGAIEPGSKPHLSYKYQSNMALHCSVSHDGDYVFSTVIAEQ